MPELKCTVQTCMHNKDFYCDLNAITVGGKSARKVAETSCDSFEERKSGTYSNVTGEAVRQARSTARPRSASIIRNASAMQERSVWRASKACSCDETECATFSCGCA